MITNASVTTQESDLWHDIPNLHLRHLRDDADRAKIVDILDGCRVADQSEEVMRYDQLVAIHKAQPQWCFEDALLVEIAGAAVGFSDSNCLTQTDGTRVFWHTGKVLPAWRGRGIEKLLLDHIERRLYTVAANTPGAEVRVLESGVPDTEPARQTVLLQAGYTPARYFFFMLRSLAEDIPSPSLPDGIEVRPVESQHYEAIRNAFNEAFADHWNMVHFSSEQFMAWMVEWADADLSLWQVAWSGDEIAGAVITVVDANENVVLGTQRGLLHTIFVRRAWRRQGLANALIARTLHMLKSRGLTEATLHVDTENLTGALRLYERVGFHATRRITTYRKPMHREASEMPGHATTMPPQPKH